SSITVAGGKAFFRANDGIAGTELWASDGTSAGTALVFDINPGITASLPNELVALGSIVLFVADTGNVTPQTGVELWRSDGTAAGNLLFCSANNGTSGPELWKSDGTPSGTVQVAEIRPGPFGSGPQDLTSLGNGLVLFRADDGVHGPELWKSDGTAPGTVLVR